MKGGNPGTHGIFKRQQERSPLLFHIREIGKYAAPCWFSGTVRAQTAIVLLCHRHRVDSALTGVGVGGSGGRGWGMAPVAVAHIPLHQGKRMKNRPCIHSASLYNKLPQNLGAGDNQHLLSQNLCGPY